MTAEKMLDLVKLFEEEPYHQYLGIKITAYSEGFSQLQVNVRPVLCNLVGTLHGGIIYSLCAIASSLAALSMIKDDKYTVANDFNISVLKSISSGVVSVEGKVLKCGRRLVFVEVKVIDETGQVTAIGRVTKTILP